MVRAGVSLLGRTFTAQEAPEGVAPPAEAVVSFLFWKTHFGQAHDVIGKTLELNHRHYTAIGIVGPHFTWGDGEVYLPLAADLNPQLPLNALIRMKSGVTLGEASGEINGLVRNWLFWRGLPVIPGHVFIERNVRSASTAHFPYDS